MPKLKSTRAPRPPRYRRLTAWQAAHELTLAIYRITLTWPRDRAPVGDELRAAVTAAATAIVIGSVEPDAAGFRLQLRCALGKLARVDSTWQLAHDLQFVNSETWGEIEAKRDHAERLTRGLYVAIGRKSANGRAGVAGRLSA